MKEHIKEIDIEQLAYRNDSSEENAEKLKHIELCSECRSKYEYFQNFYKDFNTEVLKPEHPRLSKVLNNVLKEEYTELHFLHQQFDNSLLVKENGSFVLAAKTNDEINPPFTKAAVFIDASHLFLVRILLNTAEQKYLVFIISEKEVERKTFTLQIIDENGREVLIDTDEKGFAEFQSDKNIDWEKTKILMKGIIN